MSGSVVNFDPRAPYYRAREFFAAGGKLQRCRLAFLDDIPVPRRMRTGCWLTSKSPPPVPPGGGAG
jgi:hypothetical protein